MFGGDSDPKPADGRFFVDSMWRSTESSPLPENLPVRSGSSLQSRQRFGTFNKALEQLMKDTGSPKKHQGGITAATNNDISTLQSLYISDVPDHLMDKGVMMNHFSQFGTVTRVSVSVKRRSCTVHFEDHETADKAKNQGTKLEKDLLNIFWSRPGSTRRTERKLSDSTVHRSRIKRDQFPVQIQQFTGESASETSADVKLVSHLGPGIERPFPVISIPDDVKEELDAMAMSDYNQPPQRPIAEKRSVKKSPKRESGVKQITKKRPILSGSSLFKSKVSGTTSADKELVYSSSVSMDELLKILRTPAHSSEERYRVLESRDKLMRMKRVRQSDLKKARGNQGTCPDMCPEKERYHREYQRQVASYELLLPGKIDKSKAVKEYSRSSADQEEPLSHELRSTSVLCMTMDYLIWNLMDLCNKKDENLQNWYHFIWDRTRSIRKDITQQDLCDKDTVVLVEQCARFHIYCSERLIAEDLSIYDDKINTENLTKCLQTLKYMYHDLSLKSISCPHEAEFRAYFVLLNLNEGDCMWEVQQLSAIVRQSDPVRFALQVSAALSSNNYIRFFKLVRSSTYLNACILHRYFAQVRSQALSTILKAFCSRLDTVFTLEEVVRLTGFENTQEAAVLCSHHGLQLTADGLGVTFSRLTYCQPDTILTTTRSHCLIETKRSGSVAEVVSGGIPPQSDFQSHIPHDSFGSDGILKTNAWKALDQQSEVQVEGAERSLVPLESDMPSTVREQEKHFEQDSFVANQEAERQKAPIHHALRKEIEKTANDLISQVIDDEVCSIVEKTLKDAHIESAINELCSEVFTEVTSDLIKEICEEAMTAELCLEEQREYAKQQELEADMRNKLIESRAIQEFNNALDFEIGEVCQGVIEDELARDELGKLCCEEILQQVIQEECAKLFQNAIEEARAVKLDVILARVQSRRLEYFFHKWRTLVNKSKMMQKSMIDFPAWMCNMSLDEQVSGMEQPDPSFIQHLAEKRHFGEKSTPVDLYSELPTMPIVDVGSAVAPHLIKRLKDLACYNASSFWKVVVSLPDMEETSTISDATRRWTKSIFSLDNDLTLLSQAKPNAHETVSVSLRCITGSITDVDACGGLNGVFFWLPHKEMSKKNCQRLLAILSAKPPCPPVPVAFVFTGPVVLNVEEVVDELALEKLKESSFISNYKFFYRNDNTRKGLSDQMRSACQWLARCTPCLPPLYVTSMRQLVNQCLTDELWERIRGSSDNQNPNTLVNLYNTALQKLLDLLSDNSLKLFSLGAAEFQKFLCDDYVCREQSRYQVAPEYWGSRQYFSTIAKILSTAQLSMIAPWPPLSVEDLRETVSNYCTSQELPHLIGDLFHILEQHHLTNHRASFPPSASSNWKLFLKTLPWFRVLQCVAEAKLEAMDCGFVSRSVSNQDGLLVIIHCESLCQFRCVPWWIVASEESTDSTLPSDDKREGITQKRPLANETVGPRKQQRLSLSDALTEINAVISKIDSTMKSAKITREKILATYDMK